MMSRLADLAVSTTFAGSLLLANTSCATRHPDVAATSAPRSETQMPGVQRLVHISGIGADQRNSTNKYIRSKVDAEDAIVSGFADATMLRPSVVFGPEDAMFNRMAQIAAKAPFVPVVGNGSAKVQPVYVGDVATAQHFYVDQLGFEGRRRTLLHEVDLQGDRERVHAPAAGLHDDCQAVAGFAAQAVRHEVAGGHHRCQLHGLAHVGRGEADAGGASLQIGGRDCGQGFALLAAQLAVLGVDQVRPIVADTASIGFSTVTGGSRTTFATGMAVVQAAEKLVMDLKRRAAETWGVDQDQVVWQDGAAHCLQADKAPKGALTLAALAGSAGKTGGPIATVVALNAQGAGPGFGVHVCDVEVDPETGKLSSTGTKIKVGGAVCVRFLAAD